jgi:hypothetical protein
MNGASCLLKTEEVANGPHAHIQQTAATDRNIRGDEELILENRV